MEYKMVMIIDDAFRDLIKYHRYEEYVLLIINRSKIIFRDRTFTKVDPQSHKECDYKDTSGEKYDAKLLIDKAQGSLIGERKNDIEKWFQVMAKEINEYQQIQSTQDYSFIPNTKLYQIMKERMESLEKDENVFFYSPYPLVMDTQYSRLIQFGTDFLDAVYNSLMETGLIGERKVYFIYPSHDTDYYVLRDAHSCREHIYVPEIKPLISFRIEKV